MNIDKVMRKRMLKLSKIKLERDLTDQEEKCLNFPRGLLASEAIIDTISDDQISKDEIEKYIMSLECPK